MRFQLRSSPQHQGWSTMENPRSRYTEEKHERKNETI